MAATALCVAALPFTAAGGAAEESVYTALDLDACTVLATDEESGGVDLQCEGYAGSPVFVSEGDLRIDVDFGARNDLWQSFAPFNSIHDAVEWRVRDGAAYAAIIRYYIDSGITGTDRDKGQVLVVSKVGAGEMPGCAVAAVDAATEQANGVARGAAAMAPVFDCASDRPVAIGAEGSYAFSLYGAVPEGEQEQ